MAINKTKLPNFYHGIIQARCDRNIAYYDAWSPVIETYRHNLGHHVIQRDLKDIFDMGPLIADLSPDLICGVPPSQD